MIETVNVGVPQPRFQAHVWLWAWYFSHVRDAQELMSAVKQHGYKLLRPSTFESRCSGCGGLAKWLSVLHGSRNVNRPVLFVKLLFLRFTCEPVSILMVRLQCTVSVFFYSVMYVRL